MAETPPTDFERFRAYLRSLALLLLEPRLRAKFDASDVVQKTLIDAHLQWDRFRGKTEPELRAWLRQMLIHDLRDEVDKYRNGKRDIAMEIVLENTSRRLAAWSSPSAVVIRREEAVRLADALSRLPEPQRQAIELHHLRDLSVDETAAAMGRTFGSAARLIHDGLKELRARMKEETRHE